MKRKIAALGAVVALGALLLTGCSGFTLNAGGINAPAAIDLNDPEAIAALCGESANDVYEFVKTTSEAKANSGQRNALASQWNLDEDVVNNDEKLAETVAALKVRAETPCEGVADDGTVGIDDNDGTVKVLPVINGVADTTLVMDSTTAPATPPLLDGSLRFTAQTLSWAGLVERVGDQQWYIDGVNARAAQTGFTWDDVLKFAQANRVVDGEIRGTNALAIQVFNLPGLTAAEAQDAVREYITPEVEKIIGVTVEELPIQHIDNGFVNTRNVGTAAFPKMGDYFDTQKMIRVSLMPLVYNESGEVIGLDGSRGAGIFIDCGNLHWVPKAVWVCKDASCQKPPPPPPPPPVTPPGGGEPACPECLTPKGDRTPSNGWTPLGAGPLTDGRETERQRESGDVSGNVIDNPVPPGTGSGDTTPDLPPGTVTAPGATPNNGSTGQPVEDTSNDVEQPDSNQDDGGVNGDTCITDPDTGEEVCG